MVSFRSVAIAASTLIGLSTAAPAEKVARQFTPGVLNNTQEFYIHMFVTDGDTTYTNWALEAWHTGAGTADPVFVPPSSLGSRAYLNGTSIQFDVSPYAFSLNGAPSDTNYARWEPITISSGYGSGEWFFDGSNGLQVRDEEHDGWLVCEWFHGINAPQLFQMIRGFDPEPYNIPSSCARVVLQPIYI